MANGTIKSRYKDETIDLGTITYNSLINSSDSTLVAHELTNKVYLITANIVPNDLTVTIPAGTVLVTMSNAGKVNPNDYPFVVGRNQKVFHCYFNRGNSTNEARIVTCEAITGTEIRFCTVLELNR